MEDNPIQFNTDLIQMEVDRIRYADFAHKSDRKLEQYQNLSDRLKGQKKGIQASGLIPFNRPENRSTCKLSRKQVDEIRRKYVPNRYGKSKLSKEYGVSRSVIYRIIKEQSWK